MKEVVQEVADLRTFVSKEDGVDGRRAVGFVSNGHRTDGARVDEPVADGARSAAVRPVSISGRRPSFVFLRHRLQNALAILAGDTFALGAALLVVGAVRFALLGEQFDPRWGVFIVGAWSVGAALLNLLPGWGLGAVEELRRVTLLLLFVYLSLAVALFFAKLTGTASRLTYLGALGVSLGLVPFMRTLVKRWLVRQRLWGVPAVVYGAGEAGQHVLEILNQERGLGYNPVVVFDDDSALWGTRLEGIPVVGSTQLIRKDAPVAFLAIPTLTKERLVELMDGPLSRYNKVVIIPNLLDVPTLWVRPCDIGGMLGLEMTSNLLNPLARFSKRALDLVLTSLLAVVWLPMTVIGALLVWLEDRESPFYKQERSGLKGKTFFAWKLRTMGVDAEDVLARHLESDHDARLEWETFHKLRHDPRVTRIGRFLRRMSIDELPQMYNVLRGEMSLIGPRPLPEYHIKNLDPRIVQIRERVRPGVTGMWQVSGRSSVDSDGMERLDGYYVRNWSIWLDAVILVRTFRAVLRGSGAY